MKIIIDNRSFEYKEGIKVLKLKYKECPFKELNDIWNDIKPMTFREILEMKNIECRRIAFFYLGNEKFLKETQPELVKKQTIKKSTTFCENGKFVEHIFEDTYELYMISAKNINMRNDVFYIQCKDTSTDRVYKILVDIRSVYTTNYNRFIFPNLEQLKEKVTPIDCIAWTFMTDIPENEIDYFIRQGDCLFIKVKNNNYNKLSNKRHLKGKEYLEKLKYES